MAAPAIPHGEHVTVMVFVRHGETEWNASGTVQGRLDHELNERGRQQSAKVACWLSKQVQPAAVYSSDLKRAQETAKKIVAACPGSKV
nr:unnamed protein product [Digitaria exilis]